MSEALRLMVIGAHPDDCEAGAGGLAALYRRAGHQVMFVSVTNGDAGHHQQGGVELARRRRAEAAAVAQLAGLEYRILDNHDGELEPTLEVRKQLIRLIRAYQPDLLLTHRPADYHPDHRYTSILVQDASYLITVPNICTDTPILQRAPVIAYTSDRFQQPVPFAADVVIDIDSVLEQKLDMLHCHASQMYEWLPYNAGRLHEVPEGDAARRAWLRERAVRNTRIAGQWRALLVRRYGTARGQGVAAAEAFQASEYGRPLDPDTAARLFPC